MNGIVDVYEKYFTDLTSFQFDLRKRKQHSCLVCTNDITDDNYGMFCRKSTEKFVVNYLEHLKVYNYCIILTNIFIESVRENGILSSKVKGYWRIKKHDNHEVVIIEHTNFASMNLNEVFVKVEQKLISKEDKKKANFFKKLLVKEEEEEVKSEIFSKLKEEKKEEKFDFNSELNVELETYQEKVFKEEE